MAKSTLAGVKTQEVANASSRAQGAYRKDASLPEKNLIGIPWRVAFALQADGWWLRQDIIWSKPNPMPESVTDRCTKAHEYLFLLSKSERYYFDQEAIREEPTGRTDPIRSFGKVHARKDGKPNGYSLDAMVGRNKRSVWHVATQPFAEAHFATFPPALIEPCILAGCPAKCCAKCGAVVSTKTLGFSPSCSCDAGTIPGTVLDPFGGAGTTGLVADRLQRNAILIDLGYAEMSRDRIIADAPLFVEFTGEIGETTP
jgi:hypothetical protein